MTGSIGYNGRLTMDVRGRAVSIPVTRFELTVSDSPPNVIGGSLDGAAIPDGTRDGQVLRWDESRRRWLGK